MVDQQKNGGISESSAANSFCEILPSSGALVVGCSGGIDSFALALLIKEWAGAERHVYALIVDHGLRKESREEAIYVKQKLTEYGLIAIILSADNLPRQADDIREHKKNLQAYARRLRYTLFENWCLNNRLDHVILGQHQKDQAETFLLRVKRGSGLKGLTGMAASQIHGQIRLLRPLLGYGREDLVASLERFSAQNLTIEDPSNVDDRFDRVKIRQTLPYLKKIGLDDSVIAGTAEKLQADRHLIEELIKDRLENKIEFTVYGMVKLDLRAFKALPLHGKLWLLGDILPAVSGRDYMPRYEKMIRLIKDLDDKIYREKFHRVIGRVSIVSQQDSILFYPEYIKADAGDVQLTPKSDVEFSLWQGRFLIFSETKKNAQPVIICSYGNLQSDLRKKIQLPNIISDFPKISLKSLPVIIHRISGDMKIPLRVQDQASTDSQTDLRAFDWRLRSQIYHKSVFVRGRIHFAPFN